jgi:hypothetical protein
MSVCEPANRLALPSESRRASPRHSTHRYAPAASMIRYSHSKWLLLPWMCSLSFSLTWTASPEWSLRSQSSGEAPIWPSSYPSIDFQRGEK